MTAVVMGPAVGTLVRDIVRDHLPGRQTRTVVIAMSRDANPKATVMVFVDGAPSPLLALKVGLTQGACRAVDAEARALRALAAVDPSMVHHTAPRCLELRDAPLGTALVMTARAGVPMAIDYHRWRHNSKPARVGRDFARADRWLCQLARRSGPPAVPIRWADGIRARFGSDAVAECAATATHSIEDRLERPDLGAVVHGDFWCGNILHTAGAGVRRRGLGARRRRRGPGQGPCPVRPQLLSVPRPAHPRRVARGMGTRGCARARGAPASGMPCRDRAGTQSSSPGSSATDSRPPVAPVICGARRCSAGWPKLP